VTTSSFLKQDLLRAAVLCAFISSVWCLAYGRTTLEAWRTPVPYGGDTVSFLAYLKAARDGHVVPVAQTFVPDLNAPYEANWNDYPRPQKAFFWMAGRIARILGLFATANLLLLIGHVLAGLTLYAVARYLRCRPGWAAAGAVAFAFSPYIFYRGLGHLALSLYWHIPLDLLVLGWCFRRRGLALRSRRFGFALLVAFAVALFNVYYAALFVQFLVLAALAQVARGTWRRAGSPLLLSAALLSLFALESLGTLRYPLEHGQNLAAVHRTYGDLERYALKPIELLLPLPGRSLLHHGDFASGYWDSARGEVGSAYLGLVALLGLAWLFAAPLRALLWRRRTFCHPAHGAVLWILAFSVAGGINGVLGSLGVVLLRGTNRYSIWLAAIALLFLVIRLSRATWHRHGPAFAAPALLGLVALADQTPAFVRSRSVAEQTLQIESDRVFASRVEASLPGRPMLFMLPVQGFPEGGSIRDMPDYEHFRPYLHTSRVRYSYGTDKGRPREDWQRRVEALPPAKMIDRLEAYGFSGLVVDRRAYPDGAHSLLAGLAAAGRPVAFGEAGGARVFVRMVPRAPARLPESAPRLGEGWFGRPQAQGYWARAQKADWIVDNDSSADQVVTLSFELTSAKPDTITLSQGGRSIATWRPDPTVSVTGLRVVLPPGESRLVLSAERAPALVEIGNRLRMATFAVKDLELKEE
jgi:hypothetical protein